jgi:hypothetical protein
MGHRAKAFDLIAGSLGCLVVIKIYVTRIYAMFTGDVSTMWMNSVDQIILSTRSIPFERRITIITSNGLAPALLYYAALAIACAVVIARIATLRRIPLVSGAVALAVTLAGGAIHLFAIASRHGTAMALIGEGPEVLVLVIGFSVLVGLAYSTSKKESKP